MSDLEKAPEPNVDVELSDGKTVSMPVLQSIYSEIHEKSENSTKLLTENHVVNSKDIEQLVHRLTQASQQYSLISADLKIAIIYNNNERVQMNSLDSFMRRDTTTNNPSQSILVEYSFLVKEPNNRAKNYKVSVNLDSRAGSVSKSWSQRIQATNERKTEPRPAVPGSGGHALNPENKPPQARRNQAHIAVSKERQFTSLLFQARLALPSPQSASS